MNFGRKTPLILIVDDDMATNRMLQGILQGAGFQTISVVDVAGVFNAISREFPDLILLDVNLPDGNGFDVCRRLQAEGTTSRIPVLFISAMDEVAAKLQGFNAGGVDYITKPLAGEEVIARVSTHLRLKQAFDRLAELQAERIQRLSKAQEALMPRPEDLPEARFQLSLRQVLQAGGDFYDVIPVSLYITDYIVADASGHDLAASFWTASLKALLSEYAFAINSPRDVVRSVNNALVRILPNGVFFTLIYARINRKRSRLSIVNAGHPPACILHGSEDQCTIQRQEGDVIGVFSDADFDTRDIIVPPGDRLFLYSDGLIEPGGSREEGISRLAEACRAYRQESLAAAVQSIMAVMTGAAEIADDIVLMGVDI